MKASPSFSAARTFAWAWNPKDFKINPFSLPPTKENLDFLALFLKVLIQGTRAGELDPATERELFHQVENLYAVDPSLRTLGVLANTLGRDIANRLSKWTRGGQFGFLFDNAEDTISFSRFQCFDFQRMSQYPELLEPLLFYILHRANAVIADREISSVFKAFFIDEAWVFLKNPAIQRYVVEALKTWRKHNAAMVLSTQSLDELKRSDILDVIIESCATKIFLANPDMDRELYRRQFHLNENEVELISGLIPKQQFLIKTPELAKVANLNVDPKSYWLYTNDPYDNKKRKEAFEAHGFEKRSRNPRRRRSVILVFRLLAWAAKYEPPHPTLSCIAGVISAVLFLALCIVADLCRSRQDWFETLTFSKGADYEATYSHSMATGDWSAGSNRCFERCGFPYSPAHAGTDAAARVVKYSKEDIVPVRAKLRFSTLIVLPEDEEILDFTTGDKEFWIINGAHNLCYVHPAQAGIRSNLNLITASGHVYSFLLTEISDQPNVEPDLKIFVEPREGSGYCWK